VLTVVDAVICSSVGRTTTGSKKLGGIVVVGGGGGGGGICRGGGGAGGVVRGGGLGKVLRYVRAAGRLLGCRFSK